MTNVAFLWHKVEPNQEFHGLVCEGASVRGYEEGAVSSGRSCVIGSSEISFPTVGDRGQLFFCL